MVSIKLLVIKTFNKGCLNNIKQPMRRCITNQNMSDAVLCSTLVSCVHLQLFILYLIISVHRTASWSSISLSLYWFLSISTLAISTLVKRFLWAVGTSLCGSIQSNPHTTTNKYIYSYGKELHSDRSMTNMLHTHTHFIISETVVQWLTSSSSLVFCLTSSTSSRTLEKTIY